MPSPFPGMDPYLERHWLDVQTSLVTLSKEALNELLPADLIARSEERIAIEATDPKKAKAYYADVRVFQSPRGDAELAGGVAIDAPYTLVLDFEYPTQRSIRIEDDSGTLVTVIEFLSPWHKRRPGRAPYRRKRREMLSAGVNVVEVDLTRSGDWQSLMRPYVAIAEARTPYRVLIYTAKPKALHVFPIPLDAALPTIPIPLRPRDPKVTLALQPLLDRTYRGGRYDRTVDYQIEPDPPLGDAADRWADELLRSTGRR